MHKSAWMARRESSCWWQEQTLYQSKEELLSRCCSQSCHFPEKKRCPLQAGGRQTGSVCRGWWWRGIQRNGQYFQWERNHLTWQPSLDKTRRQQESTRVEKERRMRVWSILRGAEKEGWTDGCSIIFYTKNGKQIVVLHWRHIMNAFICVNIYLYICIHVLIYKMHTFS